MLVFFSEIKLAPTRKKHQWVHKSHNYATSIILKSILNVADPCAPTRGRTWANARCWTAILKKAGTTINMRRLHGLVVTFTSPESHLVSLSITSLKKNQQVKEMKLRAQLASSHLIGPDTHLYIPNWLTFTREISFLERSDHQSTFFSSSSLSFSSSSFLFISPFLFFFYFF